jgi:hypothetical protein
MGVRGIFQDSFHLSPRGPSKSTKTVTHELEEAGVGRSATVSSSVSVHIWREEVLDELVKYRYKTKKSKILEINLYCNRSKEATKTFGKDY